MRVIQVVENTATEHGLKQEHGLSTYIEARGHKILFDVGQSGAFIDNAVVLKVPLASVDTAILSHGHYDHGGGLELFLKINQRAKIHMSKDAFQPHYSDRPDGSMKYIGLAQILKGHPRIEPMESFYEIDDGLVLFANQSDLYEKPPMNRFLYKGVEGFIKDDFTHEINLSVKTDAGYVLIAGCAHQGIMNIIETHRQLFGSYPEVVVGGFHLSSGSRNEVTNPEYLEKFARDLHGTPCRFYTCHCTGIEIYEKLKETMGDRLTYFGGGMEMALT